MNALTALPDMIGDYRVLGFLGAGGMGTVYQAVHRRLDRPVAVKVLTNPEGSTQFVERFLNEAKIQASLHHPNVATLYDFFEYDGRPCIIMEYVDGQTLSARIRQAGRLAEAEALGIFHAVVDALAYVHSHGIVHRDIKAGNVKITTQGAVKLLDFGIAQTPSSPGLTRAGAVIGTPEYLSPEQLHGHKADARSDVWALGVLLYEMLTGRVPFEAPSVVELYRQIDEVDYPRPADLGTPLSDDVLALIDGCLQRRPADRFASAQDLLQRLASCRVETVRPGRPRWMTLPAWRPRLSVAPAWSRLVARWRARRPRRAAPGPARVRSFLAEPWKPLAAGSVLVVILLGVYAVTRDDGAPPDPNPPPQEHVADPAMLHTLTIDVFGQPADVYRNGQRIGQTPYRLQARLGETVELTLRREGYRDKNLHFDVTPTKSTYTETLQPR